MSDGIHEAGTLYKTVQYAALSAALVFAGMFLVSCSEASEDKPSGDKKSGQSEPKPTEETRVENTSREPEFIEKSTSDEASKTTSKDEFEDTSKEESVEEESTEEDTTEDTAEPQKALEVVSADATPDAAFDGLLPDLRAITADTIMLPAELPEELGNPAIWSERPTEEPRIYPEYGIVFADMTFDDTFAEPPRAAMRGTLASAPVPAGMLDNVPEGFEESDVEETSLPDGTVAKLRYLVPIGQTNAASLWEGSFERDGAGYWLEVYGDKSAVETARQVLMSMVKVPNDVSAKKTEEKQTEEEEDPAAAFLEDYYRAVSDEDWSKTYSHLTTAAQDEFTEEEWATAQSIRASQNPRPPIVSVEGVGGNAAGDAAIVDVLVTYEDGTEEKLSGITIVADTVNEPYGIKRGLSESDVEYLRGLLEGS